MDLPQIEVEYYAYLIFHGPISFADCHDCGTN